MNATQITMTGTDWLSDHEHKRQARAEATRKKAAIACSKKLEAAATALNDYLIACLECNDESRERGTDDSRRLLQASIMEYSSYLDAVYNKGDAA